MPPETLTVAVPLQAALHSTLVKAIVAVIGCGSVTVICCVSVQFNASVIVTVYVPALRPEMVGVVCPPGSQL